MQKISLASLIGKTFFVAWLVLGIGIFIYIPSLYGNIVLISFSKSRWNICSHPTDFMAQFSIVPVKIKGYKLNPANMFRIIIVANQKDLHKSEFDVCKRFMEPYEIRVRVREKYQ